MKKPSDSSRCTASDVARIAEIAEQAHKVGSLKRHLTPAQWKRSLRAAEEYFEKFKPNPDGTCKEEGCDGRMVKRVQSLFHGRYHFGRPHCSKCGRVYQYADSEQATPVGIEEFERMLNTPFGILER